MWCKPSYVEAFGACCLSCLGDWHAAWAVLCRELRSCLCFPTVAGSLCSADQVTYTDARVHTHICPRARTCACVHTHTCVHMRLVWKTARAARIASHWRGCSQGLAVAREAVAAVARVAVAARSHTRFHARSLARAGGSPECPWGGMLKVRGACLWDLRSRTPTPGAGGAAIWRTCA